MPAPAATAARGKKTICKVWKVLPLLHALERPFVAVFAGEHQSNDDGSDSDMRSLLMSLCALLTCAIEAKPIAANTTPPPMAAMPPMRRPLSDEPSEDDHAPELVLHEPLVDPATLIRDADERRRGMESTVSALGPILEGVERIRAELEEHDLATPLLAQELAATQERIVDRSEALSAEIVHLKETREEIERTAGLLDELRVELDGKQDELAEMRAEAAIWASRVVDLETEVESLTARADGAARDLDRLAAACDAAPPVAAIAGTDEDHDPAEATDEGD